MNYFEEQQFWGAAFGGSFKGNFGEQLSVATSRFVEWLLGAVLVNRFAESPVLGQQLWGGNFFRTRLLVATLKSNFGKQLWGAILRVCSNIDEFLGVVLVPGGSNYLEQVSIMTLGIDFGE
jgi:hypothetical protein